jgi:hypothetical protein
MHICPANKLALAQPIKWLSPSQVLYDNIRIKTSRSNQEWFDLNDMTGSLLFLNVVKNTIINFPI